MMHDVMTQEDAMRMNNEQAIQILKPFRDMMFDQHGCPISDAVFALDKAIEALEQSQWIPCDKKLPNEDEMYYNGVGIDGVRKVSDRVLAIDSKGFIRCGYFIASMWDHPYHGAGRIANRYTDPLKACWEFGEHYQQDPENWIVGGKGDIVAWRPLPEPWKGGEHDMKGEGIKDGKNYRNPDL